MEPFIYIIILIVINIYYKNQLYHKKIFLNSLNKDFLGLSVPKN